MNGSNVKNNSKQKDKNTWLKLLTQTISKHWLSLVFVIVIFSVFRMPHLSDLTVVIIQSKYHGLIMFAFYAALVVLALLIAYSYLLLESTDEEDDNPCYSEVNFGAPNKGSTASVEVENIKNHSAEENGDKSSKKKKFEKFASKVKTAARVIGKDMTFKDSKERRIENEDKVQAHHKTLSPSFLTKKTNYRTNLNDIQETNKEYIERIFPKLLATFMIVSIAFSVNNTIDKLYLSPFVSHYFIWVIAGIFIILTNNKWINQIKKWLGWNSKSGFFPLIILVLTIGIISLFGIKNEFGTSGDMKRLFVSLLSLALLFLTLTISYNKLVLMFKKQIATRLAFALITIAVICYILLIIWPDLKGLKLLTPMVIVMICLIGLYTIFTMLRYASYKTTLPVFGVVFCLAILATILTAQNEDFRHYEVSNTITKNAAADRMDLDTYVSLWIKKRAKAIADTTRCHPFPIIMVSAEGGGSRAGHWAFLVHSYLHKKSNAYFKDNLFSITGASGGSVGSNMFYAQAYNNHKIYKDSLFLLNAEDKEKYNLSYKASKFYNNDYISSSIAGLLGRDLVASIINKSWYDDRGKITEQEWETAFNTLFDKNLLGRSYLDIMPKENDTFIPPIMVTTTTHVQSGAQYIMSPVKFEPNHNNEMLFKDLLTEYHDVYPKNRMIKRSSAMLLTARFPYISPNGRITGIGQFGDGGYYDNIGGIVTRRLEQALVKGLKKADTLEGKYEIKHLIITNNTCQHFNDCGNGACLCDIKKVNYNSQLLTPAQMVINATFAPADEFIASYPDTYRVESRRTLIPIKDADSTGTKCDTMFRPLIPLGRYMSLDAVRSLEARLQDKHVVKQLDNLLGIKPKKEE